MIVSNEREKEITLTNMMIVGTGLLVEAYNIREIGKSSATTTKFASTVS